VSKSALLGILLGALTPAILQGQTTPTPAPTVGPAAASKLIPLNARRLAPENAYARAYCIVPMVGSGTLADPKRPMFAPGPPTAAAASIDRTGIIAYQFQLSDDGNSALVEFVAVSRAGLATILTSTNPNVASFERGKYTRQQIETEFQKYKKSFSFTGFMPVRAQ
jgi:hypothetical protein